MAMIIAALENSLNKPACASHETTGEGLLNISNITRKDAGTGQFKELTSLALTNATEPEKLRDLCVLMFHTRDIRGGKGERGLFRTMFACLAGTHPELACHFVELIPHFGHWGEIVNFLKQDKTYALPAGVRTKMVSLFCEQLRADSESKNPSLAAKWAPRESTKSTKKMAVEFAQCLFPGEEKKNESYRKLLSSIIGRVPTTEAIMAAGNWEDLDFSSIPSLATNKYKNAFADITKEGNPRQPRPDEAKQADREKCAQKLKAFIEDAEKGKVSFNGKALQPHQLVKQYFTDCGQPDPVLELQFKEIMKDINAGIDNDAANNVFVMADVSGSMMGYDNGTPMAVSVALAILSAHLATHSSFMTFSENPKFVKVDTSANLYRTVNAVMRADWGYGTNVTAAFKLIIDQVGGSIPYDAWRELKLVIVSDMNFNLGVRDSETQFRTIEKLFNRFYKETYDIPEGEGDIPVVVFWNVASNGSHAAKADQKGVILLSGYSPRYFADLCSNSFDMDLIDPLSMLRNILDSEKYDNVRKIFDEHYSSLNGADSECGDNYVVV